MPRVRESLTELGLLRDGTAEPVPRDLVRQWSMTVAAVTLGVALAVVILLLLGVSFRHVDVGSLVVGAAVTAGLGALVRGRRHR